MVGPFFDQNLINDDAFTQMRNITVRLEIPLYAPNPDPANRILYIRMDAEARDFSESVGSSTGLKGLNHLDDVWDLSVVKTRDGIFGNALDLGGDDNGVRRTSALYSAPGTQNGIGSLDDMTIAFWFKAKSIPTGGQERSIVYEPDSDGTGEFSIKLLDGGSGLGQIRVTHYGGPGVVSMLSSATLIRPDEWYLILYTMSGGAGGELYCAEFDDTTMALCAVEVLLTPISGTSSFSLGGAAAISGPSGVNGIVDDLQVWKSAFDESTRNQLLTDYRKRLRSSGRPVQTETFTDDVTGMVTHIFGGGQQSGVTRRTEGRDLARQDNLLVIQNYPGFDEKASVILNNERWNVRYIQNAGGQHHHMQIFLREAKG